VPGGVDRLLGEGGGDLILDRDGSANLADGGPGDDQIDVRPNVEPGKKVPPILAGRNTVLGGPGDDRVDSGAGDDSIVGNSGRDHLFGYQGRDEIRGGSGNDIIDGGSDRDVADGGPGNDALSASFHGGCGGPDTFIGGSGRDNIYIFCGKPTMLLRDHARDSVSCSRGARPRRIVADRKDRLRGRCARRRRR
jgi:Ca2+-binding RTX toxin-like protein